jgi:spore germination protein PF
MPCFIGKIKIENISGGVVNFGDTFTISPKSIEKSITGSGGGGVGDVQTVFTGKSITNGVSPGKG